MEDLHTITIQSALPQEPGTEAASRKSNPVPQIFVARRVIEKMCAGALRYQSEETGEALIGLEMPNGQKLPRIYILDTIPPIEDTVRQWAMFEHGDDWQGAIINWFLMNWEMYRDLRRKSYGNAMTAKWDSPLLHLGDWHKQPGLIKPSLGDLHTARRILYEEQRKYLITPIVTLADEANHAPAANTILVEVETLAVTIRIDFWWLVRRSNDFKPLKPVIVSNEDLPRLPPVAWWLDQHERYDREVAALEAAGLQVMDVTYWDTHGHPPLDTCLVIYRPGSRNVFIAVTPANYPDRPPAWRIAPIMRPGENADFFEALYAASTAVSADLLPDWKPERLLLDGVKAIEAKG